MKIIHCADAHLGSEIRSLGYLGGKRKMEIRQSFFRILELCGQEQVDLLLIAGDLFDVPTPEEDLVRQVKEQMEKIPATRIFIAPGNHDYVCLDSSYMDTDWPENVRIFKGDYECIPVEELKVNVFGAAFTGVSQEVPLLKKKEEATGYVDNGYLNLGVLHGDLVSSVFGSSYHPITLRQIEESGLFYLALGHIHLRSEVEKAGNTYYSYCGNHDGRGFDELGEKGIYLLELTEDKLGKIQFSVDFRETGSRRYVELKLEPGRLFNAESFSEEKLAKAILKVMQEGFAKNWQENLYKIILQGDMEETIVLHKEGIQEWLSDVFFVKIKDQTRVSVDYEQVAKQQNLKGMFVAKLKKKLDEARQAGDVKKQEVLKEALSIGLKAFYTEVGYDVDE